MKKRIEQILNLLYPRCCPLCHKIVKDQQALICPECQKKLRPITQPRCMSCGRPVKEEEEYCRSCRGKERAFFQGRGIFPYDDRMKASIIRYKYDGRRQYGEFYARAMCVYAGEDIKRWKPDLILAIPLHPRKQRMRGFNQAWYLAERIGAYFGIPAQEEGLKKIKDTKSQKKMSGAMRRRNLTDAFAVSAQVEGKVILLIDDVYTTGNTIEAAAKCLKEAGAKAVCFLTLCIGAD